MSEEDIIGEIELDAEDRMGKSVESTQGALKKLRSGRASPALIEHLTVDYYGNSTPLNQVGNVGVADSRTLSVTPWEKALVPAIEKAIMESDLGLNPVTAGEVIRIPLPALTEERRREMSKLVRGEGENTKVAIRNIRRDAISKAKAHLKNKEISEDAEKAFEDVVQKMTDRFVANVDKMVEEKEAEIMEI